MESFYRFGMVMNSILFGSILISSTIYLFLKYCWSYVNDSEFKIPDILKYKFKINSNNELFPLSLLYMLFACIFIIIWPIGYLVIFTFITLKSMRFVLRVSKNVKKLETVSHDHPENIEKIKIDLDFYNEM